MRESLGSLVGLATRFGFRRVDFIETHSVQEGILAGRGDSILAGSEFRPGPSGRQAALLSGSPIRFHIRTSAHDLAARCARGLQEPCPSQTEGAGKAGCALHPRSRVQCASRMRTRAYRFSGEHPAFPAQWFTVYFVLSPVNGSFAIVATQGVNPAQLDASTAASGPHDFAVRVTSVRLAHASRPPHPTATFVTIATRPSPG